MSEKKEHLMNRDEALKKLNLRATSDNTDLLKKHWRGRVWWPTLKKCSKAWTLEDVARIESELKKDS